MANFDHAGSVEKSKLILKLINDEFNNLNNAQANHFLADRSKELIKYSKNIFSDIFNDYSIEFVPGGGSMANRRAILGSVPDKPTFVDKLHRRDIIIISAFEHKSISEIASNELILRDYTIIKLPITQHAIIDLLKLEEILLKYQNRVALISVMYVNNEVGSIQPLDKIYSLVKKYDNKTILHSDVAQAIPLLFKNRNPSIDIMSLSAYKLGSMHLGIVLSKHSLNNDYFGTPDTFAIYCIGKLMEDFSKKYEDFLNKTIYIKSILMNKINKIFNKYNIDAKLLSNKDVSVPYILSYLLPIGYQGKTVQKMLSDLNVAVGTGSACSSESKIHGSQTIISLGYSKNASFGLLRLSYSPEAELWIDKLINALDKTFETLSHLKISTIENIDTSNDMCINGDLVTKTKTKKKNQNDIIRVITKLDATLNNKSNNAIKLSVGECALKGNNIERYRTALYKNTVDMLSTILNEFKIHKYNNTFIITDIKNSHDKECDIISILQRIAGISKISPCRYLHINMDTITDNIVLEIAQIITKQLEKIKPVKFKINTKLININKFLNYSSTEWNRLLGQYIVDRFNDNVIVDMTNYDIIINVDIRKDFVLIYTESFKGFQGLPIGTNGELSCIMNNKNIFRSIVSAYMMLGRGVNVKLLVQNDDYNNPDDITYAIKCLSKFHPKLEIYLEDVLDLNNIKTGLIMETNDFKLLKEYENISKQVAISNTYTLSDTEISTYLHKLGLNTNFTNDKVKNKSVLMLLSGGIDSPVASYKLIQLGYNIKFIHFATNIDKIDNILDIKKVLYGNNNTDLIVIEFSELQNIIVKICKDTSYRTIMYKIFMILISNNIAKSLNIDFIGTGNSWGQVASQTNINIRVTHLFSKLPIISPLLGFCKEDIIKIARDIGTFKSSTCDGTDDCCVMFLPKHPQLKANYLTCKKYIEEINKLFNIDNIKYKMY